MSEEEGNCRIVGRDTAVTWLSEKDHSVFLPCTATPNE